MSNSLRSPSRWKVPDECYLVTNGEIDEAVYHQIHLLNESLVERGHAPEKIKTITRGTLLKWANELGLSLWPSEIEDFANLVKILNHEGNEMFPAKFLDPLLRHTLAFHRQLKAPELRRRITSAAIITAVALHSFSGRRNHFAEITGWTMFITYAIAACEKNNFSFTKNGAEAAGIARDSVYDLLGLMCQEAHQSPALVEGDVRSEFAFYRPRALLIYMLMAIYWIWSEAEGWKKPEQKQMVEEIVPDNLPDHWLWGEAALPHFLTYLWYRKKHDATVRPDLVTAAVLRDLMANKLGNGPHLASPYYGVEDIIRHEYKEALGCDDPFEGDSFQATSYFAESLMVFLVRANLKQTCKGLWPDFSKYPPAKPGALYCEPLKAAKRNRFAVPCAPEGGRFTSGSIDRLGDLPAPGGVCTPGSPLRHDLLSRRNSPGPKSAALRSSASFQRISLQCESRSSP